MSRLFKTLLFILALVPAFTLSARDNIFVDLDAIKKIVKENPEHYTALLNRFVAGDSTLNVGEVAIVYYGHAFTPEYKPGQPNEKAHDAYKRKDYPVAAYLSSEALLANPVSLDMTVINLIAANHSDLPRIRAKIPALQNRFDMLATTILSSGNGTTSDSPFVVIDSEDIERVLLNVIGAGNILGRAKVGDIDAVKITFPGEMREHILYFDTRLAQGK